MFRDRVVGHYVGRGYRVDTDAVLTGSSNSQHKVDLLATDDLGRLAVWWGDVEDFEGPELESLKRAASDLNAAPAIAVPQPTAMLRDHARRLGVVVVDESVMEAEAATMARPLPPRAVNDAPTRDLPYPAWPDPDRGSDAAIADPVPETDPEPTPTVEAPWKREGAGTNRPFGWLHEDAVPDEVPNFPDPTRRRHDPRMPAFWAPLLFTAIGLLVLMVVLAFLLGR